MKLNLHITLTVLSGVSLAGLLSGCSMPTKEGIARSTMEYNLVAEKAGNEMLLLNIVRASKRRPMYFTSFGKLTGNMTFEIGTGSMNIPFGKIGTGLNGSYSIAPSAGYKYSPLFDLSVLDTQEFTRGIMKPVPMKTIEYYRSQGWPKEMLLHLFIRRIEIKDPNYPNRVEEYVNYPGNEEEFNRFQNEIRKEQWDIKAIPDITKIGEVDACEVSKLQNLIKVHKAGLTLTPVIKKASDTSVGEANTDESSELQKPIKVQNDGAIPTQDENKMELRLSQDKYVFTRNIKRGEKIETIPFDEEQGKIYTRSPEAILYYLGEIMRAENNTEDPNDPNIPMVNVSHDPNAAFPARLFYARKATDNDIASCVSVDYEGAKYVIPGDPDGKGTDRSMHVLSLVSQLIGLQKKSEELPATGVVTVVGR